MYCPTHFQEDKPAELVGLIEQFPLATVIYQGDDGLTAEHIPLLYEARPGGLGKLMGHVAKNNPLWQVAPEQELLLVFQGPSTYISPNWYASKSQAGKVVPTWNYAVVHAHCTLNATHDPAQVLRIITELTDKNEAAQAHPWRVTDAPAEFTKKLLGNIVGISLEIKRWQGKWKVSQNQTQQNRQSVIEGLRSEDSDAQRQMALLVQSHATRSD
ncbi:FMN-binding negative transcriptional regulator [Methylomonas sp. MO1]|uniref:FMN-binding negative transcriptional regulator n=1 Tax=unclassified Methylomonas TaxID=2608980 RepID=UPI00047CDAAB|nr:MULTISPECIES: FMN-binding negative transcriptional regulator [unclassified Methylomonas]MDT4289726.1 FMN-binding negative transcriptional regulator [Methylomonas sp. MO1]